MSNNNTKSSKTGKTTNLRPNSRVLNKTALKNTKHLQALSKEFLTKIQAIQESKPGLSDSDIEKVKEIKEMMDELKKSPEVQQCYQSFAKGGTFNVRTLLAILLVFMPEVQGKVLMTPTSLNDDTFYRAVEVFHKKISPEEQNNTLLLSTKDVPRGVIPLNVAFNAARMSPPGENSNIIAVNSDTLNKAKVDNKFIESLLKHELYHSAEHDLVMSCAKVIMSANNEGSLKLKELSDKFAKKAFAQIHTKMRKDETPGSMYTDTKMAPKMEKIMARLSSQAMSEMSEKDNEDYNVSKHAQIFNQYYGMLGQFYQTGKGDPITGLIELDNHLMEMEFYNKDKSFKLIGITSKEIEEIITSNKDYQEMKSIIEKHYDIGQPNLDKTIAGLRGRGVDGEVVSEEVYLATKQEMMMKKSGVEL